MSFKSISNKSWLKLFKIIKKERNVAYLSDIRNVFQRWYWKTSYLKNCRLLTYFFVIFCEGQLLHSITIHNGVHGVMVSTLNFLSSDQSSNLGNTFLSMTIKAVSFYLYFSLWRFNYPLKDIVFTWSSGVMVCTLNF